MSDDVRVRFAPSPTGHLHIGNARTAILNWIFARRQNGTFILRIEDTDLARSTAESEKSIVEDLKWLGLDWDEGPETGGAFGPYRQSERGEIYRRHFETLRERNLVYPCYLNEEELASRSREAIERGESNRRFRANLEHSAAEIDEFEAEGRDPIWLFALQDETIAWDDMIKGSLSFAAAHVGDFVVLRSDGQPTYNFAAAVDDGLMRVTHVLRGDDHVSNTPKQVALLSALGFFKPHYAHVPMILGPDRTRLSKRHGATSLAEFKEAGYLPETLINFLSLLAWSSASGDEILDRERLISEFDFDRMSKSPAIFNKDKLDWMSGVYFRDMAPGRFIELCKPYLPAQALKPEMETQLSGVARLIQGYITSLADVAELAHPFFSETMEIQDGEAIAVYSRDSAQKVYWAFLRYLRNYGNLDTAIFRKIMQQVQRESGVMGKELWMPIRVALTGKLHGPDLAIIAEIYGRDKVERFVRNLVD